jgi:hypothetical protein
VAGEDEHQPDPGVFDVVGEQRSDTRTQSFAWPLAFASITADWLDDVQGWWKFKFGCECGQTPMNSPRSIGLGLSSAYSGGGSCEGSLEDPTCNIGFVGLTISVGGGALGCYVHTN